jgi:hypothetical protein
MYVFWERRYPVFTDNSMIDEIRYTDRGSSHTQAFDHSWYRSNVTKYRLVFNGLIKTKITRRSYLIGHRDKKGIGPK